MVVALVALTAVVVVVVPVALVVLVVSGWDRRPRRESPPFCHAV